MTYEVWDGMIWYNNYSYPCQIIWQCLVGGIHSTWRMGWYDMITTVVPVRFYGSVWWPASILHDVWGVGCEAVAISIHECLPTIFTYIFIFSFYSLVDIDMGDCEIIPQDKSRIMHRDHHATSRDLVRQLSFAICRIMFFHHLCTFYMCRSTQTAMTQQLCRWYLSGKSGQ